MRVCFFNRSYWPDMAATGQLLTELAEDLAGTHGYDVSVVAGRPLRGAAPGAARWAPITGEARNGVRIFRANGTTLAPRRFAGRAANYLTYFASACLAGLRIPRPDVVVALTDPPIIGLAALMTARLSRARFVFLCEDVFPEVAALLEDFHSDLVNRTLDRLNRHLLRHADAVVALGDRMKRRLVEEKGARADRVHVIHNWADCAAIVPQPKDGPFAREHGLVDRFVLMHSGNVGLSQALDVLLDAAALLQDDPSIVIVIVGDGTKRAALEARAASEKLTNVRFLPYQPKAMLAGSFAAADVFLVSLEPGLEGYIVPSKLYGILAAGRAFIAAVEPDCEAAVIAREDACGLAVPPRDPEALAAAVRRLAADRALTARLGLAAREAARRFDRPVAVGAYAELLRRVAGR
ncbi:MAG TPA: glycosyltransferase family 4 protein [Vicinamibacterales bacterium]|nr:glycosyltransferase family 4 protein [Vicinamibacterales bacterium]